MKRRAILSLILASVVVTACGSNSDVQKALPVATDASQLYQIAAISTSADDVPEKFRDDLRKYLEKDLKKNGMLATGNAARKVNITITEFKMSKGASRLLGPLAGSDLVRTHISVVDTASNKNIGVSTIESKDSLAGGGPELFTSNHAKAISRFLQGRK